jgi:hypothetical protein
MEHRYFTMAGNKILQSNGFNPQREYIYAGEYTSCTGRQYGDVVGWRYSDLTLEWGELPQTQLNNLIALSGQFEFKFLDGTGTEVTEQCMPTTQIQVATRHTNADGSAVFKDVQLGVKFVESHT